KFINIFISNLKDSKLLDHIEKFKVNLGKDQKDISRLKENAEIELIPMILDKHHDDYRIEQTIEKFNNIMPDIISKIEIELTKKKIYKVRHV
ncbi:MAG: hypothetical protein LBB39_02515, partial [Mycoplasmataceae bacterium]|nr:hypothetical protein [Mycoplasmataceae bacterium]